MYKILSHQPFFILLISITIVAETILLERCSHLMPELNTCTFIDLHYNKTHFEFSPHYDEKATLKVRVINSTLSKLGKNGLCMPKYTNVHSIVNIEEMDLTDVQLEELERDAFENCVHLKKLILRRNRIEMLDKDVFSRNRDLQKIDLANNLIRSLEHDVFAGLEQLKELFLCNNFLKEFEPSLIETCVNLEVVKLDSNDLFDLNTHKMMENAPNLKKLTYNNNQMRCGRMRKMSKKLSAKEIDVDYEYEGIVRDRIQSPETDEEMICLNDMAWSAAHYVHMYNKMTEDY